MNPVEATELSRKGPMLDRNLQLRSFYAQWIVGAFGRADESISGGALSAVLCAKAKRNVTRNAGQTCM